MSRYHVATPAQLELVRQAINVAWRATPAGSTTTHLFAGGIVIQEPSVLYEARLGLAPEQIVHTSRLVLGGDGSAALELPDASTTSNGTDAFIGAQLGQTVNGTPIPSAAALVQIMRARDHSLLPTGVRDVLDDRYVDGEFDKIGVANGHASEALARAAVTAELQGARATAALARKDVRASQQALEAAMGIGRSR